MCKELKEGCLARRVKPTWLIESEPFTISTAAFDLRDGTPPERFVSFYLVNDFSSDSFARALQLIKKGYKSDSVSGAIFALDVKEALEEVNDDEFDIIEFYELHDSPHSGLFFVTDDQKLIQEAKNTLCLLARERIYAIKENIEISYGIPLITCAN